MLKKKKQAAGVTVKLTVEQIIEAMALGILFETNVPEDYTLAKAKMEIRSGKLSTASLDDLFRADSLDLVEIITVMENELNFSSLGCWDRMLNPSTSRPLREVAEEMAEVANKA